MAQLVKRLTPDFFSSHDLTVGGMEPCVRLCADSMKPAWDSLSLSTSPQLAHMGACAHTPSQNKQTLQYTTFRTDIHQNFKVKVTYFAADIM